MRRQNDANGVYLAEIPCEFLLIPGSCVVLICLAASVIGWLRDPRL
jgi:hypothetical protein